VEKMAKLNSSICVFQWKSRQLSMRPVHFKHRKRCSAFNVKKISIHNSWHYPSSCLLFKTQRFGDWILSLSSGSSYSVGPVSDSTEPSFWNVVF
jgi:hypothetical protein